MEHWRYQVSDVFASYWHDFGMNALRSLGSGKPASTAANVYRWGNRLTTRRAADEYFFKMVPTFVDQIEFVYPTSVDERLVKAQLSEWLKRASVLWLYRTRMFLAGLFVPVNFLFAKVFFLLANTMLIYNIFRMSASMRAHTGSTTIQKLIDKKRALWTPSDDLQTKIETISDKVSADLLRMQQEDLKAMKAAGKEMGSAAEQAGRVWRWTPNSDMHDLVVAELQKQLKAPELSITYRRSRMQYLVYKDSI
ncbi:hypothetical protein BC831DRAFT_440931 [Entophlyctis helioformis]|nr:hypothetical protein BC831DRAFT_440931 [Entophlyctis helioformis]